MHFKRNDAFCPGEITAGVPYLPWLPLITQFSTRHWLFTPRSYLLIIESRWRILYVGVKCAIDFLYMVFILQCKRGQTGFYMANRWPYSRLCHLYKIHNHVMLMWSILLLFIDFLFAYCAYNDQRSPQDKIWLYNDPHIHANDYVLYALPDNFKINFVFVSIHI